MRISSSIAALLLAVSLFGCKGGAGGAATSGTAASQKKGEVVATVGKDTITVDEFKAKMDEQSPFVRARYTTIDRKKEFLDNLVRFDLLAQEAERQGLDKDPEVQETLKKVMVQTLIRKQFDDNEAAKNIPDPELEAYYKEHLDDYVKPERVRVSHVFFAVKDAKEKAKVKAEASKALAEIRGKEAANDRSTFVEIAKNRSDDTDSKLAGGDLSFKTKDELTKAWGQTFADASFAMTKIGDVGTLVETDKGFHVVKLTGRQNALDRPFETVKSQIQNRLFRERRTKGFDDFVKDLREKANVQVKDDVLAAIEVVPPGAPGAQAEGAPGAPMAPGQPMVPGQPMKLEIKPAAGGDAKPGVVVTPPAPQK
jgi:peptidyl-prolyl cis-trans isomerase C